MKNLPLYQRIFEHYYEKIMSGQIKEGEQINTEKEIMEIFYVSRITAKAAIDMLAERGLVTRISGRGTFVCKTPTVDKHDKKEKMIGIILCDIDYSFGFDLLKGIEDEARERNIHILFRRSFESAELEYEAIDHMVKLGVNGIIIQTVHGETYSDQILKLYLNGFPFVLIDRHMNKTKVPFVTTDNEKAAKDMTKYLQANGYKNISFMSACPHKTSTLGARYDGFRSIVSTDKKMDLLNLITPELREKDKELIEKDYTLIRNHILKNPKIDCIFAAEFYVARLVKKVLESLQKRVPDDMGIACFDSEYSNLNGESMFTHVAQQQYQIGKLAVTRIDDITKGIPNVQYDNFLDGIIVKGNTIKTKSEVEV